MNYKQINESWQRYLTEAEEQTLGDFVLAMRKSNRSKKIFNAFAKLASKGAQLGVGKAIGAVAGGVATGGLGTVGGLAAGVAIDKAVEAITDKIIENSEDFVKAIIHQYKDTPDDEVGDDPLAKFFDIDDKIQTAMRGGEDKDGHLLQLFEKYFATGLKDKLETAYDEDNGATRDEPLSSWLTGEMTANQELQDFVKLHADTKGVLVGKESS